LYYKSDIILSKTNGFTVFTANVSLSTKRPVSDVISICGPFECVRLAKHICGKITSKRCFHFNWSAYC